MATSALDPASLASLRSLPTRLSTAHERAVGRSAFAAKRAIQRQSGYASRLSGVGRSGARLNIRYDLKGHGLNTTALVRATGPFHLLERPTKAHTIAPRRGRRGGGKRAVVTPYGPRASVQHPGTSGKHPFEKGVNASLPAIRAELRGAFAAVVRGR